MSHSNQPPLCCGEGAAGQGRQRNRQVNKGNDHPFTSAVCFAFEPAPTLQHPRSPSIPVPQLPRPASPVPIRAPRG